jgi:hypothetical protein
MPLITYCQRLVQRSLFSIFSVAEGACKSAAKLHLVKQKVAKHQGQNKFWQQLECHKHRDQNMQYLNMLLIFDLLIQQIQVLWLKLILLLF